LKIGRSGYGLFDGLHKSLFSLAIFHFFKTSGCKKSKTSLDNFDLKKYEILFG